MHGGKPGAGGGETLATQRMRSSTDFGQYTADCADSRLLARGTYSEPNTASLSDKTPDGSASGLASLHTAAGRFDVCVTGAHRASEIPAPNDALWSPPTHEHCPHRTTRVTCAATQTRQPYQVQIAHSHHTTRKLRDTASNQYQTTLTLGATRSGASSRTASTRNRERPLAGNVHIRPCTVVPSPPI